MRSPEGVDFPVVGEFLEVDPPSRIVFTDDVADEAPAEWRARLDGNRPSSQDGGTLLSVRDTFASDEDRDAIMRHGAVSGWSESMERLEALVTAA